MKRHTYANVASTLALVIALGGTGYAAAALAPHSVGTRQLKDGAVTSKKVRNFSLTYKDFKGGQLGLILGYAHVRSDGTVDVANSFEVGSANVKPSGLPQGTCLLNLPFTVHGVVITPDGADWGEHVTQVAWDPGDPAGDCPYPNPVGEVLTGTDASAQQQGHDRSAYYIAFF